MTEGLRIVQEGVANFVDVDRVMREYVGLPMGPFELFDLTGLDVSGRVLREIYDGSFKIRAIVQRRWSIGGWKDGFGRKVGEGFYRYLNGKKVEPEEFEAPLDANGSLYVDGPDSLKAVLGRGDATLVDQATAANAIRSMSAWRRCDGRRIFVGHDPKHVVAIDMLFLTDTRTVNGRRSWAPPSRRNSRSTSYMRRCCPAACASRVSATFLASSRSAWSAISSIPLVRSRSNASRRRVTLMRA